uniref:Putative endothelial zinc finger protein induced by tumor necrosis factor alpha n=1 Tax=Anopheles darlingi TaxID=43151 RepID=A0A2M4CHG1_ANODA
MMDLCRLCAKRGSQPLAHSLTTLKSSPGMKSLIELCIHGNEPTPASPIFPTSQLISSDDGAKITRDPQSTQATTVQRRDRLEYEEEKCNNNDLEEATTVNEETANQETPNCTEQPGVESRIESNLNQPIERRANYLRTRTRSATHDESTGAPVKRRKSTVVAQQPSPSRRKQICQVCGKVLSNKATFRVHMKIHTQEKSLTCSICDRRFYVKQQLRIHMESFHEQKEFVCTVCGLKCRWRKSLARHMQLHAENPYKHKCNHCEKAFSRPNQLRIHTMKHTGDRVCCDICGAAYMYNYMLTQHKIRKHGMVVEGVQLYKRRRSDAKDKANLSTSQKSASENKQ